MLKLKTAREKQVLKQRPNDLKANFKVESLSLFIDFNK